MNQEFEVMPFAPGSGGHAMGQGMAPGLEWGMEQGQELGLEQERGGRFGGGGMRGGGMRGRPGGGRAGPYGAPGRGPGRVPGGFPRPRPRSSYWPRNGGYGVYGGWPYDVVVAAPVYQEPAVFAPPGQEPYEPGPQPYGEPGPDYQDGELPPTLLDTLNRLPANLRPAYQHLGALPAVLASGGAAGPGLYFIAFNADGRARVYSGQSANVRRRLQQHMLCATMLGLRAQDHQVYMAPASSLLPAQRRDVERRIHTDMFARHPGVLTNQRRELEAELLGEAWL
jgi:hypothetical protein